MSWPTGSAGNHALDEPQIHERPVVSAGTSDSAVAGARGVSLCPSPAEAVTGNAVDRTTDSE